MNVRALMAAIVVGLATVAPHGQEAIYKAGNRTVAVYATVTGPDGRLVPDLTRDAFSIEDNGRRQEITLFANTIQPITVVVNGVGKQRTPFSRSPWSCCSTAAAACDPTSDLWNAPQRGSSKRLDRTTRRASAASRTGSSSIPAISPPITA